MDLRQKKYFGRDTAKMDDAGRVSIPKSIAGKVDEEYVYMVMVKGDARVFDIVSESYNNYSIDKYLEENHSNEELEEFFGSRFEVELDSKSRIMIPRPLRDRVNPDRKVLFIGMRDSIRLKL